MNVCNKCMSCFAGKYAIKDLVAKLPSETMPRDQNISDDTISAVLGVLYQTILGNVEFARNLLESGGVERLMYITKSRQPAFNPKVVKYASQVGAT